LGPAQDPLGPAADRGRDVGGFEVVGEPRLAALLTDIEVAQQVVGLGQQRHPDLHALPGVHHGVVVHVGLDLDQPALDADPSRTPQGRHRRGARHASSQQGGSGLLDRVQPLRGDVGPVDPHHIPVVAVVHQQVQAGRPAQVDLLGGRAQPPLVPQCLQQARSRPGSQPSAATVGVIHRLTETVLNRF